METANAELRISSTFAGNNENEPDLQLPLSVDCSDKCSYEQGSPPICYVDLGGHKPTEPNSQEQQAPADVCLFDSPSELSRSDLVSDVKNTEHSLHDVITVNSAEQSNFSVKDGGVDECTSIIPTPAECIVSSSVVQDQKNTTMASVPGPLINCPPSDHSKSPPVIVDIEQEAMEIDDDDDDIDDRPLVLDLGDNANTSSPSQSPSALPVVTGSEGSPGAFRKPLAPPKTSPRVVARTSSAASTTSTTVTVTSTPTPRVQKPIRPFILQHFNAPENNNASYASSTSSVSLASSTHHLPAPLAATTIRLQTLPSQPPPPPPGPPTMSGTAGSQQTNGVQFMSLITPPPSVSSAVSPSPIHLFNLAAMPGYLNAASGVLFQSIPSSAVATGGVGGQAAPPGSFQFATPPPPPPPPPLFPPQAFPPPPPHFTRPPSTLSAVTPVSAPTAGSLPPSPLAPANGLTSMHHANATRTPLAGLFIPDMSTWMATVTGAQTIPPLQPIFSAQPASLATATISSGEVIYSTVLTTAVPITAASATTGTPATNTITTSSASVSNRLAPLPSSSPTSSAVTSVKLDVEKPLTSPAVNGATPSISSNFSISARRWRPSFGRKSTLPSASTNATVPTTSSPNSSIPTLDAPSTAVVSSLGTASTSSTVSKPLATTSITLSTVVTSVPTVAEVSVPKSRNLPQIGSRRRPHEDLVSRKKESVASSNKPESIDSAAPEEEKVKKDKDEKFQPATEVSLSSENFSSLPPPPPPPLQSSSCTHLLKRTMEPPTTLPSTPATQPTMERKIISHFIDGHVLYESNLPFPVRNAMAIVRATLQCTCDAKSRDAFSRPPVRTNHNQEDYFMKEGTKPNGPTICDHSTDFNATTAVSEVLVHRRHSVGLSASGRRRRRLSKSEVSKTSYGEREMGRIVENGLMKKRRKKSPILSTFPVTSGSIKTAVLVQNGHKESSASADGIPVPSTPKDWEDESPLTPSPSVKLAGKVTSDFPASVAATTSVIESTTTTTTSVCGGGSGGSCLKVTIHSIYPSGGNTPQSPPNISAVPMTSNVAPCPATTKSASLPSPPFPDVSTPPSTTLSTVSVVVQSSVASRADPTQITKAPTSTPTTDTIVSINTSSTSSGCVRSQQIPSFPPLPRGPVKSWSPSSVAEFVRGTPSCAIYADAFKENEIDGEALLLLTPSHFVDDPIRMKIGHALKLAHRVRQVVDTPSDSSASIGGNNSGGGGTV